MPERFKWKGICCNPKCLRTKPRMGLHVPLDNKGWCNHCYRRDVEARKASGGTPVVKGIAQPRPAPMKSEPQRVLEAPAGGPRWSEETPATSGHYWMMPRVARLVWVDVGKGNVKAHHGAELGKIPAHHKWYGPVPGASWPKQEGEG